MMSVTTIQFAMRLFTALLLGAAVGLERQWRQRMAGTRTNALVAAGASAFVMAGSLLVDDPSATGRVVSYVVSGVGFLGAGVIFKDSANIRGLNTAATIWCSAAVGVLARSRRVPSISGAGDCRSTRKHSAPPARLSHSPIASRANPNRNDL